MSDSQKVSSFLDNKLFGVCAAVFSSITLSAFEYPLRLLVMRRQVNQVQVSQGLTEKQNNIISTFSQVRKEGKRSIFKGVMPYLIGECLDTLMWSLVQHQRNNTPYQVLIYLVISSIVYPFELASNLMACKLGTPENQRKAMMQMFRDIKNKTNNLNYYKGFSLYFLGLVPYSIYQVMFNDTKDAEQLPYWTYLLMPLRHPLETIRLRLILSQNSDTSYKSVASYVINILKKESPKSFFAGCTPFYLINLVFLGIRYSSIEYINKSKQ